MPAQADHGAATASPPSAKTEDVTADVPSTAVRLKGGVGDEMFEGMSRKEGGEERVEVVTCYATSDIFRFVWWCILFDPFA